MRLQCIEMLSPKAILVAGSCMLIMIVVLDHYSTPQTTSPIFTSPVDYSQREGTNFSSSRFQVGDIARNASLQPLKSLPDPAPEPAMRVGPHLACPSRETRKYPHFSYPSVHPFSWKNKTDVTNETFSTYEVVNAQRFYSVCDELELRIFARNGRNESKQYGGDYFRAKIFTQNKTYQASSSTDGEIVDNRDGTYSAYFTLKWSGVVKISVSLVHPSEAVHVLDRLRNDHQPRQVFLGGFESSQQKKTKETYCNYQPRKTKVKQTVCNFTDPTTGEPWYCEKPTGFNCSHWKKSRLDGKQCGKESVALTNKTERDALSASKRSIDGLINSIRVISTNMTEHLLKSSESQSVCTTALTINQSEVAGYYENDAWQSSSCRILRFRSKAKIQKCLSNKQVYFWGDSTIRQLFEYYIKSLNLTINVAGKQKNSYTGPLLSNDTQRNISILFAFHTVPIGRNSWTFAEDLEYIANRIDEISSTTEFPVVVVSVWAHFTSSSALFYEHRVRGIVNAMGRLLKRNKRAVVLFKGANTREHGSFSKHACCSDWYARDLEARMRTIVFQDERIGFINAWDMTNAHLQADNVHPGGFHVANLNDQLLTLLGCI